MMTLYCDESDDGETYALAGWLAVPSAWDRFDAAWREMLESIIMPDGGPCPAFHAADIVGRDTIKGSRFKGWTFQREIDAFTKATDLVVDKRVCALMWPIGCAVEVPANFKWIQRDSIWLLLFLKLFHALIETYPAQRGIAFVFDEKPSIAPFALAAYNLAKERINGQVPDYATTIAFGSDQDVRPLQAADFLVYEWRKRISDARLRPTKRVRESYRRMREVRNEGALWRYGRAVFDEALKSDDQSAAYVNAFVDQRPTHYD